MRLPFLLGFITCVSLAGSAQTAPVAASTSEPPSSPASQSMPSEVEAALGLHPLLEQLQILKAQGQDQSLSALSLRQQLLTRILAASFDVDSVLGRIDTEASYASEDRYLVQVKDQRQANVLNLVTFAASGALGAAGNAMQLTSGLNHAGVALSAAAGGTALTLSAIQLKAGGGKQPVRSPYNMLAEILDQPPNPESRYPPLVMAYLRAPRPGNRPSIAEGITAAWRRLHRLREGNRGDGAPVADLVADRASGVRLTADELADREAMLHDLRANVNLLHADLQKALQASQL